MTSASTKNGDLSIVFSVQGTGGSPTGPDPENRVGDRDTRSLGPFLLGCKCPVSRGIVVQEQNHRGDLPTAFFLQNVLQLHQQRWVILCVDSLPLWKIINQEDAVLSPKNWGENFSSGFLHSEFLGAGWAAMLPVQIFMNDGPNLLTWDAQLLSYWFSQNPAIFQD